MEKMKQVKTSFPEYNFECSDSIIVQSIKGCTESAHSLVTSTGQAPDAQTRLLYGEGRITKHIVPPYVAFGWTLSYDWVPNRLCLLSWRMNHPNKADMRDFAGQILHLMDEMHYDNGASGT